MNLVNCRETESKITKDGGSKKETRAKIVQEKLSF